MNRFFLFLAIITLLSCQTNSYREDRLRIGSRRGPDSFNPYLSTTIAGEVVAARLFPTLFREEPLLENGIPKLTPILVRDYAWDESETTLTINILTTLKWSDGEPVSAHDIGYTLGIQVHPKVAWISAGLKTGIKSWRVISSNSLEVSFKRKSPFNLLDLNEGVIVPKHHFEKIPIEDWSRKQWWKDLVVYGPYRVVDFQADERLILESIKPGEAPTLGMAFIREKETLYQLLLNHELDFAWGLSTNRMVDISERLQPVFYEDHSYGFIGWNSLAPDALKDSPIKTRAQLDSVKQNRPHPLFADEKVRLAMTYALRRQHYIDVFWKNKTSVPATPWQAGLAYIDSQLEAREFNAQKAALLLDEAGWLLNGEVRIKDGRPFSFTLSALAGNPLRESYLLAIQADLRRIGVQMKIDMQEASRYVAATQSRNFDAIFVVFRTGSRPDDCSLFHGDAALESGYNYTSWTSADTFLEKVRDARDAQTMQAGLREVERLFYEEQPFTMLYSNLEIGAAAKGAPKPKSCYMDPLYLVETWKPEPNP